jgi:hypothetical protein
VTLLHPLLVFAVGLLLLLPAEVRSQATDPVLFREFGQVVASNDVTAWRKYWSAHFSPKLLEEPDSHHARTFGEFWDLTRGLGCGS